MNRVDTESNRIKILMDLFFTFLKIGAFTIGGGLAMLPVIEKEIVDKKKYIGKEEIVDAFAVSQSLPGIIAINSAIYVGYRVSGILGAIFSALGVILPSFVVILAIAIMFTNTTGNIHVNKALTGVKAGIAGVIVVTVIKLGKKVIKDAFALIIAVVSFICIAVFDISIVIVLLSGAFLGYLYYGIRRAEKNDSD